MAAARQILTPSQINTSREHRRLRLAMRNRLWRKIDYVPHDHQRPVHDAIVRGARFLSTRAGRRSGKSELWATEVLTEMAFSPIGHLPFRYCLIGAPETDITDHIFGYLWRWIVDRRVLNYEPLYKATRERRIEMPWHSKIEGKTTDNPTSLRGPGLVITVADEYAFGEDILDDHLKPPLLDCSGILGLPTTPNGQNHAADTHDLWLELMEDGDPDYFATSWTSYDNPHLPAGAVAKIEQYARRTGNYDVFCEEYLAQVGAMAGAMYPMFDKRRHVGEFEFDRDLAPLTLGVDWGFSNPAAVGFWQFLGNERALLHDEIYERGLVTEELADLVLEWCAEHDVDPQDDEQFNIAYCDPSGPKDIEVFERKGIPAAGKTATGGKLNDVRGGIGRVRNQLSRGAIEGEPEEEPAILIHKRCVNHIREIPKYMVKRTAKREPDPDEKPRKIDDHACDEMRYAVFGELGEVFDTASIWL